jgi:hypothetical protein
VPGQGEDVGARAHVPYAHRGVTTAGHENVERGVEAGC